MPFLSTLVAGSGIAVAMAIWRGRRGASRSADPDTPGDPLPDPDHPADDGPNAGRSTPADSPADAVASDAETRHFALAVTSLSLGCGGLLGSPVLGLLAIPPMVVIAIPLMRERARHVRDGERRSVALMELTCLGGALLTGQFVAAAFGEVIILGSDKLLRKTRRGAESRLAGLFGDQPRTAWVMRDGVEMECAIAEVARGEIVRVTAGSVLPIDGVIAEGLGHIDERALTGESQPAEKGVGEPVFASTMLLDGELLVRCERTGDETLTADILRMIEATSHYTDTVSSRGERIVDRGALPTLALAALTWPILGAYRALAVSYSSFGYPMRVAAPISVLNFLGVASRRGLLIKDGRALEELAEIDIVLFDKTGTLTEDLPVVDEVWALAELDPDGLLAMAAAVEQRQAHPIAKAIISAAADRGIEPPAVDAQSVSVGSGVSGQVAHRSVMIGSARMMDAHGVVIDDHLAEKVKGVHDVGGTVAYVSRDGRLVGAIALRPMIRPEASIVIQALRDSGIDVAIVSGDHEGPARAVAEKLGIERVFAGVLPHQKSEIVTRLQAEGRRVAFVGDGINDAVALKSANVSISIEGATTVAVDSASIVLMDGRLTRLPELFDLASEMKSNLSAGTALSVLPGIASVALVYTVGMGLVGAIMFNNLAYGLSVTNAMRPLIGRAPRDADRDAPIGGVAIDPETDAEHTGRSDRPTRQGEVHVS